MGFTHFIQYVLKNALEIQWDSDRKSILIHDVKPIDKDPFLTPEVLALSIELKFLLPKLLNVRFNFLEFNHDEMKAFNHKVKSLDKATTEAVFDQLITLSEEDLVVYIAEFKKKLKSNPQTDLFYIYSILFYYDGGKIASAFKELLYPKITNSNLETYLEALNSLPEPYFSTALSHFSDKLIEVLNYNNIYLISTKLDIKKYEAVLTILSKITNEEKLNSLFGKMLMQTMHALIFNHEKDMVFYTVMGPKLSHHFSFEYLAAFIPNLWHLYFVRKLANESSDKTKEKNILKTIQRLGPEFTEKIHNKIYKNLKSTYTDLRLHPADIEQFLDKTTPSKAEDELDKDDKLEIILKELKSVFDTPQLCVALLKSFDKELEQSWKSNFANLSIEQINKDSFVETIGGLPWHISKEAPKFSTQRFLVKNLVAFMQARGFAQKGYASLEMIKFHLHAEPIKNGDLLSETGLNPYSVFSGKLTNALRTIILIRAWEEGLLSFKSSCSIADIFEALVSPKFVIKSLGWPALFSAELNKGLSFTEPHVCHALLMSACTDSLPYLSNLLRHSFSKRLFKLNDLFNNQSELSWDLKQFLEYFIKPRIMTSRVDYLWSNEHSLNLWTELDYQHQLSKEKLGQHELRSPLLFKHSLYKKQKTVDEVFNELNALSKEELFNLHLERQYDYVVINHNRMSACGTTTTALRNGVFRGTPGGSMNLDQFKNTLQNDLQALSQGKKGPLFIYVFSLVFLTLTAKKDFRHQFDHLFTIASYLDQYSEPRFRILQSYIEEYSFNGHPRVMNLDEMSVFLENLEMYRKSSTWTEELENFYFEYFGARTDQIGAELIIPDEETRRLNYFPSYQPGEKVHLSVKSYRSSTHGFEIQKPKSTKIITLKCWDLEHETDKLKIMATKELAQAKGVENAEEGCAVMIEKKCGFMVWFKAFEPKCIPILELLYKLQNLPETDSKAIYDTRLELYKILYQAEEQNRIKLRD